MSEYKRAAEAQPNTVDVENGTFEAVLFTDGEASDGHILNMRGASMPSKVPLFVNHVADPRTQIGVLEPIEVTPHEIRVRGQVLTEGDGAEADVRRDLLLKMRAGHVTALSGRWDPIDGKVKPRSSLPKSHPAYVERGQPGARGVGLYFEQWRGIEGSVVGLGADPQATLRWAEEAESPAVAAFWRSYAEPAPEAVEIVAELEPEPEPEPEAESTTQRLEGIREQVKTLLREGVAPDEIVDAVVPLPEPEPESETNSSAEILRKLDEVLSRLDALEEAPLPTEDVSAEEEGGSTVDPTPSFRIDALPELLEEKFQKRDERILARVDESIRRLTGRV